MEKTSSTDAAVRRIYFWTALAVLLFLTAISAVLSLLAHNESLFQLLSKLDEGVNRKDRNRYSYEHYFPDFEDRLINEEMPADDYSRGGVYLVGTSNLKWATRFWELPPEERSLIHNYGIGGTDHYQHFQLLRYLVEHRGLFEAGGGKNLVVLATSYHALGDGIKDPNQFFGSLWRRHGLYSYGMNEGITPLEANPLLRALRFERIRIAGFARSVIYTMARQMGYHTRVRKHDPADYQKERSEWMGPDWRDNLLLQVSQFEAIVDYLREREVKLVLVFLPVGTWDWNLPFQKEYMSKMTEVARRGSVEILDWTRALDDEDFADSNHTNPYGVDKLQPRFLGIAIPFLRANGTLLE